MSAAGGAPALNPLQRTARAYLDRGWAPIVLPFRSKQPATKRWPELRLTAAKLDRILVSGRHNLSLLTGPPSGGLADVDLDTPEARTLARATGWLPPTDAVFGRAGSPRSHALYTVADGPARVPGGTTRRQSKAPGFAVSGGATGSGGATPVTHCELRWGPGLHTVAPASHHEGTGEAIVWMPDPKDDGTDAFASRRPEFVGGAGAGTGAVGRALEGGGAPRRRVAARPRLAPLRGRPLPAPRGQRPERGDAALPGLAPGCGPGLPRARPGTRRGRGAGRPPGRGAGDRRRAAPGPPGDGLGRPVPVPPLAGRGQPQALATGPRRWPPGLGRPRRPPAGGPPGVAEGPTDQGLPAPVERARPSWRPRDALGGFAAGAPACAAPPGAPAGAPQAPQPPRRIPVELVEGDVYGNTAEVLAAVHTATASEPRLFKYGGVLARLVAAPPAPPGQPVQGVRGGALVLQPLTTCALLLNELLELCDFVEARGRRLVPATPGQALLQNLLATPASRWGVPALSRLVDTPVFTADARLLWQNGYDPRSGICLALAPELQGLSVPVTPSRADADAALAVVFGAVWKHFPFRGAADKANALAGALTPLLRALIDEPTPLHAVLASTPGTGKSLLARSLASPFVGDRLAEYSPIFGGAHEEAELRKEVTSFLGQGVGGILFDNAKGKIAGSTLEGVLTRRRWTDRLLGGNLTGDYPITALWLLTANNPELTFESARRTVPVFLDPLTEDPTQRPDIPEAEQGEGWLRTQRQRLVGALLTLAFWWQTQPRTPYRGAVLGGYEAWSRTVGAVLEACGVFGFLANVPDFRAQWAIEDSGWRDFVLAWHAKHGDAGVTAEQLWTSVGVLGDYFDELTERGKEPAKSLGRLLLHRMGASTRTTASPARRRGCTGGGCGRWRTPSPRGPPVWPGGGRYGCYSTRLFVSGRGGFRLV